MSELLGLRGRFAAALVAVSALTLAVTALLVLFPLDRKLEQDALTSLEQTARAARPTFEAPRPRRSCAPGRRGSSAPITNLRRQTGAEVFVFDAAARMLAGTDIDGGDASRR